MTNCTCDWKVNSIARRPIPEFTCRDFLRETCFPYFFLHSRRRGLKEGKGRRRRVRVPFLFRGDDTAEETRESLGDVHDSEAYDGPSFEVIGQSRISSNSSHRPKNSDVSREP